MGISSPYLGGCDFRIHCGRLGPNSKRAVERMMELVMNCFFLVATMWAFLEVFFPVSVESEDSFQELYDGLVVDMQPDEYSWRGIGSAPRTSVGIPTGMVPYSPEEMESMRTLGMGKRR